MREVLSAPRLLLPPNGYAQWAVPPEDGLSRADWREIQNAVGDSPSALQFCLPVPFEEEIEDEAGGAAIFEKTYAALENSAVYKLPHGGMYVKRKRKGETRRGVVLQMDLEALSDDGTGAVLSPRPDEARVKRLVERQKDAVAEFFCATVLYRDKRDRAVKILEDEELEKAYGFDLLAGGGRLTGYFLPFDVLDEVTEFFYSRTEPSFLALDGVNELWAAKRRWDTLKAELPAREQTYHPARYALIELVNFYGEGVRFLPVHRGVRGVEREAFYDYMKGKFPLKREGELWKANFGFERAGELDEEIGRFVKQNGGSLLYFTNAKEFESFLREEDTAGIAMAAVDEEAVLERWKKGRAFPARALQLGAEKDRRYYLEGKETSYD